MNPVHIARCSDYEPDRVETAVRESVDALGGIGRFVQPGQRVLLKANLLRAFPPQRGITTHPTVVQAVVRLVQEAGGTAMIGDSPLGPFNARLLRAVYRRTGMASVAERTGARLNFDTQTTQVSHPQGRLLKGLDVIQVALEADVILSLPKLKTHNLTRFTGATKNLFGTVPGITKAGYHVKLQDVTQFSEMLIDVLTFHRPALTIMDGVVGMEGDGPSAGQLRQVGVILASPDGVALDVVATSLVGIKPLSVPPLRAAHERGLTTGRLEDVELLGAPWEEVRVEPFKLPTGPGLDPIRFPRFLRTWGAKHLVVNPSAGPRCTGCAICRDNCPMQAITVVDKTAIMDWGKCIRCYCCHEVCPESAVELHRSWLGRVLGRVGIA